MLNLARTTLPVLIAATAVALSLAPGAVHAQGSQPRWVANTLAGLIRNCSIPASQLALRWNPVTSTLQVEASPTLSEVQQQCVVAGLKGAAPKIEGLPSVPAHFSHSTK